MTKIRIEQDASKLAISGELTRHTLNKKNAGMMRQYLTGDHLLIDLSAVKKIDTAGLAWLLSIVEAYAKFPGKLHFTHLSGDFVKLSKLSGVDSIIPTLY